MSKATIAIIVYVLFLSMVTNVAMGLWTQDTFHAANFWSNTHLYVNSDLPGKINVHTGDYDNVHFTVNKSGSDQVELDHIQVHIHRNDGGQLNVSVYYGFKESTTSTSTPTPTMIPTSRPTSTADDTTNETGDPISRTDDNLINTEPIISGSSITVFSNILISVLAVLGVVFIQDKRQYMVVILLLGICFIPLLQIIQAQQPPSADIDIYIPKKLALKNFISIKASQATIKVARHLFTEAYHEMQLECFSIDPHQACPSCCNGGGHCVNAKCECSFGFNGTECQNQTLDTSYQIYTNPLDSRLMAVFTPEGDEIIAFGNKTAVGVNSTITEFIVNSTDGKQTFTKMDSQGRVESASDSDGNEMQVTWEDGNSAVFLEVIFGNEQLNLHIDLDTVGDADTDPPEGVEVEKRSIPESSSNHDEPEINWQRKSTASQQQNPVHKVTRRNAAGEEATVYVSVSTCGNQAVDGAAVSVEVYNDYNEDTEEYSTMETYTALPTSTSGQYKFVIPSEPANENTLEACDTIVSGVETGCQVYDLVSKLTKGKAEKGLCAVLASAGFAITKIPSTWSLIYKFCTTAFKGIGAFCNILDTAGKVGAVTDVSASDLVCGAAIDFIDSFINYFTNQLVLLRPKAIIQGQQVVGDSVTTELEEGQSTSLTVTQLFSTPQILDFYSVPNDPAPFENYIATVVFTCYSAQAHVFMSILGTDGYYDSLTCTGGPECNLWVPGAVDLVRDTVTVRITDPPGSEYFTERVIYLVF